MKFAVEASGISHFFGKRQVLQELSFRVAEGDFFVIIGPNGSGKTTLMKLVAGILKPPRGRIEIMGRTHREYTRKAFARMVAYVPQKLPLEFPFRVTEAVLMGRAPYHGALAFEQSADFEIARRAMEFTQVEHLADRRLDELSGGEQQRVFIARAICQDPKIMLLDEPTASLDFAHQVRIMDLMQRLRSEKGVTVVMVSHDVNLAAMYGSRILILKNGERVSLGEPSAVLNFDTLEEAYDCKLLVDKNPLGEFPRVTPVPGRFLKNDPTG